MFFGRKPQPERSLSLASLDERLRIVEALLGAPEAKRLGGRLPRTVGTLQGALASLGLAIKREAELPRQDSG